MSRPVTPLIAADIIIELVDQPEHPIVLIERKYPPLGWAIPGGFVDIGESIEQAAIREALEETCMKVSLTTLLGIYSNPARDPRGHTATAVYIATATGMPKAADDAQNVALFAPSQLPKLLAFDHDLVLQDYLHFKLNGQLTPLRGC
jgi:8-oxo-dGTP diphosphatase